MTSSIENGISESENDHCTEFDISEDEVCKNNFFINSYKYLIFIF